MMQTTNKKIERPQVCKLISVFTSNNDFKKALCIVYYHNATFNVLFEAIALSAFAQ